MPTTSSGKDEGNINALDGNEAARLGSKRLQINPEVLQGVPPLPGLEDLEVVLVQSAPSSWARWTEGILIHVVGTGLVAVLSFVGGMMFAGLT